MSIFRTQTVSAKYARLIKAIVQTESSWDLISKDECYVHIRTYNSQKEPIVDWEIYQQLDAPKHPMHDRVKITCAVKTNGGSYPITKLFHESTHEVAIFDIMMWKIINWKLETFKRSLSK